MPGCSLSAGVINQTAPPLKERASLVFFSLMGRVERFPCLIVNRSQDGFGLVVGSRLQHGKLVDLILDEEPSKPVHCRVTWIGEPGSKQEGCAGLQPWKSEPGFLSCAPQIPVSAGSASRFTAQNGTHELQCRIGGELESIPALQARTCECPTTAWVGSARPVHLNPGVSDALCQMKREGLRGEDPRIDSGLRCRRGIATTDGV